MDLSWKFSKKHQSIDRPYGWFWAILREMIHIYAFCEKDRIINAYRWIVINDRIFTIDNFYYKY